MAAKTFKLNNDIIIQVDRMTNSAAGELFKEVLRYVNEVELKSTDKLVIETFDKIKHTFVRKEVKVEKDIKWKYDFEIYLNGLRIAYTEMKDDIEWLEKQQSYYPNLDLVKSIEKACTNFWATQAGWNNKKKAKINEINWKQTFANALTFKSNHVYGDRNNQQGANGSNNSQWGNTGKGYPKNNKSGIEDIRAMAEAIIQNHQS